MIRQLEALLFTLKEYGHPQPKRLATDKPSEDNTFFQERIPSLATEQERLDAQTAAPSDGAAPAAAAPPLPPNACTINLAEQVTLSLTLSLTLTLTPAWGVRGSDPQPSALPLPDVRRERFEPPALRPPSP